MIVALVGFPEEALLIASGSVAVVYGERRPYRIRWLIVATAGAALVSSVWIGAMSSLAGSSLSVSSLSVSSLSVSSLSVSSLSVSSLIPVLALTAVAAIAVYVVAALRLGPPGAFFPVLVCAMSSYLPGSGIGPGEAAGFAALGAASALLASVTGVLRAPNAPEQRAVAAAVDAVRAYLDSSDSAHRHTAGARLNEAWTAVYDARASALVPELRAAHLAFADAVHRAEPPAADDVPLDPFSIENADRDVDSPSRVVPLAQPRPLDRLRRSATPVSHASTTALRVVVAALAAGGLSIALGLDRPDWAVLGAVLVLQQGPDRVHGTYRGIQRIGGTMLGVAVFAALFLSPVQGVGTVAAIMALLFAIETTLYRNYGLAVVFITPLALTIGSLSHPHAVLSTVVLDRIVETTLGVACAFAALWLVLPHNFRRSLRWSDVRVYEAAAHLHAAALSSPIADCIVPRRALQYELVAAAAAAAEAAHNDRRWTATQWRRHAEIERSGYALLAACWRTPGSATLPDSCRPDVGPDEQP